MLEKFPSIRDSIVDLGLLPPGNLPGPVTEAVEALVEACAAAVARSEQLQQQPGRAAAKPYLSPTTNPVQCILRQVQQLGGCAAARAWMQQQASVPGRVEATGPAFRAVSELLQEGGILHVAVCGYLFATAIFDRSSAACQEPLLRLERLFAAVVSAYIWRWEGCWGPYCTWLTALRKHFAGWCLSSMQDRTQCGTNPQEVQRSCMPNAFKFFPCIWCCCCVL